MRLSVRASPGEVYLDKVVSSSLNQGKCNWIRLSVEAFPGEVYLGAGKDLSSDVIFHLIYQNNTV